MTKMEVAARLPDKARELFYDITDYRVLGASKHIEMIGDIFVMVAADSNFSTFEQIYDVIGCVARYLSAARGESSQAINNVIDDLLSGINAIEAKDVKQCALAVKEVVDAFRANAVKNIDKLLAYAADELSDAKNYLLFDYSSTVCRYLERLKGRENIRVYVPESRIINGGYTYAITSAKALLNVGFFPDAAMLYFLKKCDAAIIGAETFNVDGTAYNTIGSDILAELCYAYHVPLYVFTLLNKVDKRSKFGKKKGVVMKDLNSMFTPLWDGCTAADRIDCLCPELISVAPEYIKSYVTECGVIAPQSLYSLVSENNIARGDG